jgi:DNA-binding NtrC family response regulator
LENFVKRYLVLGDEEAAISELERGTEPAITPHPVLRSDTSSPDLKQMVKSLKNGAEMEAIANALEENGWNRKRAASILNISYKALLYKIRQYGIRPRQPR